MPPDVVPNLKPDPELCSCGCGVIGRPNRRNGHARGCDAARCASCRGRRNRKGGLAKQNQARKALGVPGNRYGDTNEERWSDDVFANEVKSGDQCGPLFTWWRKVEAQVRANEADHGSERRPVRAVAMPSGTSRGLVVVEVDTWRALVAPALEEFYGPEMEAG